VVIIVIVLLIVINGHGSDGTSAAVATSTTPAPTPTIVPSTKPPTKPPKLSPSPVVHSSSPTSSHTPKPPKPKPTHFHSTSPKPTVVAMAPVQVLNNSRITGLAHHVAAEVQAQGWTIAFIGNLQGRVPETTVYYAIGDGAAAAHLAHEFSSIRRIEPNSEGGIHASNLTLVATSDWFE
jgi:LytR cell envelope-related transcriptional attenuator